MIRQTREMTPKNLVSDLIFKDECYSIVGACFEVYKDKGCGFHEPIYQECLGIEFEHCRIPAIALPALSLEYRGRILQQKYFPDFICYGKIVVELKAVAELTDDHRAQVLNYLKASGFQLGLLINFGLIRSYNTNDWPTLSLNSNPMNRFTCKALALFGVFSG